MTARARETALAAVSRRRGGGGRVLAIGGTVLAAVAVGVVIGSFAFAERGTASEAPGLGFLPAEGWTVLQSGTPATPERPGVALAANVPLHPQDTVDGFPYSTLRLLPPHGVVLVASFMRVGDRQAASEQLPLSLREAVPYIRYGGEVRPKRPLGQYELRAMVAGYAVEVQAYFGTREPASAVLADAQGSSIAWSSRPKASRRRAVRPACDGPRRGGEPRVPALLVPARQLLHDAVLRHHLQRPGERVRRGPAGRSAGRRSPPRLPARSRSRGGTWEAVPDRPPVGGEFRARWNDEISEPVTYKPPLVPAFEKVGPGKFRASVWSYPLPGGKQSMNGGRIDLQRLALGQWKRLRTAKLKVWPAKSGSFGKYWAATFTVPTQGLTLRAFVPAKTGLPCSTAGASKSLRS